MTYCAASCDTKAAFRRADFSTESRMRAEANRGAYGQLGDGDAVM